MPRSWRGLQNLYSLHKECPMGLIWFRRHYLFFDDGIEKNVAGKITRPRVYSICTLCSTNRSMSHLKNYLAFVVHSISLAAFKGETIGAETNPQFLHDLRAKTDQLMIENERMLPLLIQAHRNPRAQNHRKVGRLDGFLVKNWFDAVNRERQKLLICSSKFLINFPPYPGGPFLLAIHVLLSHSHSKTGSSIPSPSSSPDGKQ